MLYGNRLKFRKWCININPEKRVIFAFVGEIKRQFLFAHFAAYLSITVGLIMFFLSFLKATCDPVLKTLKVSVLN
jgi:hypothetical protein